MAWVILIVSGVLEAVWATALGKSEGFTKLWPSVIFFVALVLRWAGSRGRCATSPPAPRTRCGSASARHSRSIWAMITGETDVSWVKVALLTGLVGCVVGLKFVDGSH